MEDGKRGTVEENIESRREPLLPADVSWRLNLQEFPALPPRRDEHGSIILRRFRRTTGQPSSQILMYICIMFLILFSKGFLLFCFLLILVSFIMARPYVNIEWKFCFWFLVFSFSFLTKIQDPDAILFKDVIFAFRIFSVKQLMYILIYVFIIYLILCSKRYLLFCFSLYMHKVQWKREQS